MSGAHHYSTVDQQMPAAAYEAQTFNPKQQRVSRNVGTYPSRPLPASKADTRGSKLLGLAEHYLPQPHLPYASYVSEAELQSSSSSARSSIDQDWSLPALPRYARTRSNLISASETATSLDDQGRFSFQTPRGSLPPSPPTSVESHGDLSAKRRGEKRLIESSHKSSWEQEMSSALQLQLSNDENASASKATQRREQPPQMPHTPPTSTEFKFNAPETQVLRSPFREEERARHSLQAQTRLDPTGQVNFSIPTVSRGRKHQSAQYAPVPTTLPPAIQPTVQSMAGLEGSRRQRRPLHSTVKVLILGAGPTGLGAAHQLQAQGVDDWIMLDSSNRPGGMAVTEVDKHGFRWDLGGHVIHSRYEAFDKAAALHKDWVHPRRGGWVRVQDQWCPTPIQQSLGNLTEGKKISKELDGKGRGAAHPLAPSKNLSEYYKNTFGQTLDKTFFTPFNFKQWAWKLDELDHTWTSLRSGSTAANVPQPNKTLTALTAPKDTSPFPYPRLGTGSLWKSVASALPADKQWYKATVERLDLQGKRVYLSTGETISFSRCISTIPLTSLLKLAADQRPDLSALAPCLKHSSTTVIGLGFQGELPAVLRGKTWIFSADPKVSFHRASVVTNFSRALSSGNNPRSGPRWSIMFEVSSSVQRPIDVSPSSLVPELLEELQRWGALAPGQAPLSVWHKHLRMGYPLPFLGRDELLSSQQKKILPELEKYGILPRGRFGGWRYESSNQDCAFVQGTEAVDLLLKGKAEREYWPSRPDHVKLFPLEDDAATSTDSLLVAEKNEEKPKKRRGFFGTCKALIQANYFVIDSSPEVVLPEAPNDQEKLCFVKTHRFWVVSLGIFAFLSSSAGLWLFTLGGPPFYWFGAFCALAQITTLVFLLTSAFAKTWDHAAHTALVEKYGIHSRSGEKNGDVPTVDIYLPCCKEPLEVLENTYGYVKKLSYPKSKLQVHVLDDGGMDEVKELADRFGFNYIRRENRGHLKKAGNLRNAYANTTGEYFAIFDADFCPRHDFLIETVPMMRSDKDLAIIQTPQYFRTTGALGGQTWVERGAGAVQELFYRLIMTCRATWGGAICAGSCAFYRREALKKLGGTAPLESSEDIWTGFYLIQDGWKVNYLPLVLSCGNCPDTARAYFSQQIRWCEGSCSLVLSKQFWTSKFTVTQKLMYFSGLLYYLDQALTPFYLPLPSILLVWLRIDRLLWYSLAFAIPTLLYAFWLNKFWSRAKTQKSIGFINPVQSYAYATAFKDRLLGSKYVWVPTGDAKSHKSNRYRNSRLVCIAWTFTNTAALGAGIAYQWILGYAWYNFVPIIALQAYSVYNLIPFMLAA